MMISAENNEYLLTHTDTHTVTHTQMASWGSIIWESNHCACVLWVCQWQHYNTKIMNNLFWYMTSSRASGWMEWKKSVMNEDSDESDASCIKLHIITQGCEYMEGDNSIIFISLLFPRNKNVQTWGALIVGRPYWGFCGASKTPPGAAVMFGKILSCSLWIAWRIMELVCMMQCQLSALKIICKVRR